MENAYFQKILIFRGRCSKVLKISRKTMDWGGEKASKINELWMLARMNNSLSNG